MNKDIFSKITLVMILLLLIFDLVTKNTSIININNDNRVNLCRLYQLKEREYYAIYNKKKINIIWGTENYPMTDLRGVGKRINSLNKDELHDYGSIPLFFTQSKLKLGEKEYRYNIVIDNGFQIWMDPDYNFNNSVLINKFWQFGTLFGLQTFEELLDNKAFQDKFDKSTENNTIGPFVFNAYD